jgi:hypothetical protein
MDEQVWKSADEWRAAAPYAIHFQLTRANGQNLYVDELNWWPLTFSLKCRQIIAKEADFVAPAKPELKPARVGNPISPFLRDSNLTTGLPQTRPLGWLIFLRREHAPIGR